MLNKIATFSRFIPRVRNARCMGHGLPANFKPIRQICEENKAHMNYMPVPQGSWQEAYNANNAQMNVVLLGCLATAVATFGFLFMTDCIYFHGPPPRYVKRENFVNLSSK